LPSQTLTINQSHLTLRILGYHKFHLYLIGKIDLIRNNAGCTFVNDLDKTIIQKPKNV